MLVPVDLVFYPLRAETFGRKLCFEACSSGVAAFTDQDEAVRRGLLELVERDAVVLNWFSRRSPQQVAHEQMPYHWRRRAEYWQGQGRRVYVLDLSAHGAVVVNVAIVSETDYPCFMAGAGASERSFDEALAKAFHEAETMLLQALRRPRAHKIAPEKVVHPADHARLYAHPDHLTNLSWLWSGETATSAPQPTASIAGMLEALSAVVVDLSYGDSTLEVVRVISAALVPINFGYGNEHYTHRAARGVVDPACLSLPHYFP